NGDTRTVTIKAREGGDVHTTALTVKPWLASLKLSPPSVNANTTATGTLTLNVAAPANGLTVALSSSDASVTVPATLSVPGGTTTQTFNITVGAIATAKTVQIKASYLSDTVATLYVNPANVQVKSVAVSPASVVGGFDSSGVVTLTKA